MGNGVGSESNRIDGEGRERAGKKREGRPTAGLRKRGASGSLLFAGPYLASQPFRSGSRLNGSGALLGVLGLRAAVIGGSSWGSHLHSRRPSAFPPSSAPTYPARVSLIFESETAF